MILVKRWLLVLCRELTLATLRSEVTPGARERRCISPSLMDCDEGSLIPPKGNLRCCYWKKEDRGKQSNRRVFQELQRGSDEDMETTAPSPRLSGAVVDHKACHVANRAMKDKPRSLEKPEGHTRTVETSALLIQKDWCDSCTL